MIVILALLLNPLSLDSRESSTSIAVGMAVRNWCWSPRLRVEDTGVGVVEVAVSEIWLRVPGSQSVSGVGSDVGEDICADVPAAESVEIPVGLDGGDLGVVVVEVGVSSTHKMLGDSITEENTENAVLDGVGLVLVEGDEDQGALHEVLVVQQRGQEVLEPLTSNRN